MSFGPMSDRLRNWADALAFATAQEPTPKTGSLVIEAADILDELTATLSEVRDNLSGSLAQMALGARVNAAIALSNGEPLPEPPLGRAA